MVKERIVWEGLKSQDYIHPDEEKFLQSKGVDIINAGLDMFNDFSVSLLRRITLGRHIEISEANEPLVMGIVKDVCRVLDYHGVPRVFVCHQAAQTLFCAGTDHMQITLSDYILDQFDRDMLYYEFGNMISMFKSGHVKLVTVCSMMMGGPKTEAIELMLKAYLRAADMSSDRGGLLACQSYAAAARCILWETGVPLGEIRYLTEQEMIRLSREYIEAMDMLAPDWMTVAAAGWKKYNKSSSPSAYRLKELLDWYQTGYCELQEKWGGNKGWH